jgi:Delta3-Delta2-enoyl-CoA isomerase
MGEPVHLERDGDVWVLRMDAGENRFDGTTIPALHRALDRVEETAGPAALVTTGSGRFFSNGLDLDWLLAGEGTEGFLDQVYRLFGRVLGLDMITVAAVNGHAFAGGAMLAAAHDLTVMREDRGYWCVPEVDLGLPLTPPMLAVLAARLPAATLSEASLTGRRYGGPDAVAAGIAMRAVPEDQVVATAVELAAEQAGKDRSVIAAHKRMLHAPALERCGIPLAGPG